MKKHFPDWPKTLKRTTPRLKIFSVLEEATEPLSAAQIAKLTKSPDKKSWYSTVYRVLNTFLEHDLVIKTSVSGSEAQLFEINRKGHHQHYARCEICDQITPIDICPIDQITDSLDGFRVMSHRLELSGVCRHCDEVAKQA